MAETILEALDRLEATAAVLSALMERVSNLESEFEAHSSKAAETVKAVSWADTLPERLDKIEETATPIKQGSEALKDRLQETAQAWNSLIEPLDRRIQDFEQKVGIS